MSNEKSAERASNEAWRRWFERLGDKASAEIVDATKNLVTDERLAALVQARVLPDPAALGDEAGRQRAIKLLRELRETTDPAEVERQKASWRQLEEDLSAATTPLSTLAKAAAEEIQDWNECGETQGSHDADVAFIQAIIERCLAGGSE